MKIQISRCTTSLGAALMLLCLLITSAPALAAQTQGAGLSITPALVNVAQNSGQSSSTFTETIENASNSPFVVDVAARDFTTLGGNGSLQFLNGSDKLHGLSTELQFSPSVLTVGPSSSRQVVVTVKNEDKLAPGGHYTAITFAVENSSSGSQSDQISAHEELSSLVFLSTYGNTSQAVHLDSVSWRSLQVSMEPSIDLAMSNVGNVQTVPRGLVIVTNRSGGEVARGIVNVASGMVLPGTNRLYEVPLRMEGHIYPGEYHVKVAYGAGQGSELIYTKTFIVLTQPVVTIIVMLLLLDGIWLIRRNNTHIRQVFKLPGIRRN